MFIFLVVILNSCGSAEFEEIENQYETKMELDKNTFVEQIYTEVVGKDAEKSQIRVYVKFRVNNDVIKLPEELHYNGLILTDDGKYSDLNKGDGVYTSFTDVTKVDYDYEVGSKFFIVYENNLLKKVVYRLNKSVNRNCFQI